MPLVTRRVVDVGGKARLFVIKHPLCRVLNDVLCWPPALRRLTPEDKQGRSPGEI